MKGLNFFWSSKTEEFSFFFLLLLFLDMLFTGRQKDLQCYITLMVEGSPSGLLKRNESR